MAEDSTYPIYVRAGAILPILDHENKHASILNAMAQSNLRFQVYVDPLKGEAEGYVILDDGATTDLRQVKVTAHYSRNVFSLSVEPVEGYSPNKVIDSVEIIGLQAVPMGIKFNGDVVDKYKANFRVDAARNTVLVHRLNLKITEQAMEKVEIFSVNVPSHYIG